MKAKKAAPAVEAALRLTDELKRTAAARPAKQADPAVIGRTTFDSSGSEDMSVTVLLAQDRVHVAPSQSLVRVVCRKDGRKYLGVVDAGPFSEPDSLRPDSPILVTVATQGADYMPRYHGRVRVKLLGEELADGALSPPRLRPLSHSPVYLLGEDETAKVLRADGDIRLGLAVGHERIVVGVPSASMAVLPRHTAILGTTGGGKSTTVAGLVRQAALAGMAVIVLDVEGEYARIDRANDDPRALTLLRERGLKAEGVPAGRTSLYHLVGRDTANPHHPDLRPFSLQFARLSPYAAMGMMECNDAQSDRYLFAYDVAKGLLRELGVFPEKDAPPEARDRQERLASNVDDFERGYPRMKLSFLLDIVAACKAAASKSVPNLFNPELRSEAGQAALGRALKSRDVPGNAASWGKVYSLLWRLHRLRVFDRRDGGAQVLKYKEMLRPGHVSVLDLTDAGLSELSNIAVADVLRGVQEEQDRNYRAWEAQKGETPPRVLVVIEEAHEFLGAGRRSETPHLFEQVGRLAKRGRKRWMSLALVTQLPQHLPREVLAMCNNFILHKLTDPQVIASLRHTVSGVEESL
ncbi:MAG: ATP-binding protein, partial [Gemmataceae bacterium]